MVKMSHVLRAILVSVGVLASGVSLADFPEHTVKIVSPYAPGGSADMLSRLLAEKMADELKKPVIVENKPGASTQLATRLVAKAKPDGYTLLLSSNSSMVLNPMLYKDVGYNPEEDFDVLSIAVEMPLIVVTNNKIPADNLKEFIDYAKEHKDNLNYASIGLGNPLQLATQLLLDEAGVDITHIPFNGSSPSLTSVMSNETQLMVDGVITSLPFVKDGKLKALAVASSERLDVLPDVPTVDESGIEGYQASTWFGLAVPKKTDPEIKEKLKAAIDKAIQDPSIIEKMEQGGMVMQKPESLDTIREFLDKDRTKWQQVIDDSGIQLD